MDKVTIGEIAAVLALIVGLITGVQFILKELKKSIKDIMKEEISPIQERLEKFEKQSLKTDLVNLLCLAEKEDISTEQKIRLSELYDRYTNVFKMNSYVHDKYTKLKKEGKV